MSGISRPPAASWRGDPHTLEMPRAAGRPICAHTRGPEPCCPASPVHTQPHPPPLPHAVTARQLFPQSETEPASRGCRYLISWICHLECLPLSPAPGSSCQAPRSPGKQAEQAAGFPPALPVHLCDVCSAWTQPAFKGLIQLCFFPLPLFSPSWATLSSLAASWDCAISAPERARSPEVLLAPLRLEGCMLEGWGASGMGDAWWERC